MLQHPFQKGGSVEEGEITRLFPGSEEAGNNFRLAGNGHGDTPFAGAIEFGEDKACEWGGRMEFLGLDDGVAPGGGIGHQKDLMGCRRIDLSKGAFHLGELLHEIRFGMKTAGRVADEEVGLETLCLGKGIMAEGGGIGAVFAADHFDS